MTDNDNKPGRDQGDELATQQIEIDVVKEEPEPDDLEFLYSDQSDCRASLRATLVRAAHQALSHAAATAAATARSDTPPPAALTSEVRAVDARFGTVEDPVWPTPVDGFEPNYLPMNNDRPVFFGGFPDELLISFHPAWRGWEEVGRVHGVIVEGRVASRTVRKRKAIADKAEVRKMAKLESEEAA